MTIEQDQKQREIEAKINRIGELALEKISVNAVELFSNSLLEDFTKITTRKIAHELTGVNCNGIPPSFHVIIPAPGNDDYQMPPGLSAYQKAAHNLMSHVNIRRIDPNDMGELETPSKRDDFLFECGHELAEYYNFPLAVFMVGQAMYGKKKPKESFEGVALHPALTLNGLTIDGRVFSSVSRFVIPPGGKEGLLLDEPNYFFSHNEAEADENGNMPQIPMNVALDAFFYGYFCGVSHWHCRPQAVNVLQTLMQISIDVHNEVPHGEPS